MNKMVTIDACVYFNKEIEFYINETQKKRNVIYLNLSDFSVKHWSEFQYQYNFESVEDLSGLMTLKSFITDHEFLSLIGSTFDEAIEKSSHLKFMREYRKHNGNNCYIQVQDIVGFYNELKRNTIKQVELSIDEQY
jgi:hypothetical protein